jgi:glutamate carboxypeptidase
MDYMPHLLWLETQQQRMCNLLREWVGINSFTRNMDGLGRMLHSLREAYGVLGSRMVDVALPPQEAIDARGNVVPEALGKALHITRHRPNARRVLLGIHMDTVYGPDQPFQGVTELDGHTWRGPGVADAKGGLVVLLLALEALERSPFAGGVSWEVIVNPDEEIGSPGSSGMLAEAAARNEVGMIFEPALPDGGMVSARKGSGNFTVVIWGRAAHAGRDFHLGRSAIKVLAELTLALDGLNDAERGITVNVGRVEGGSAVNVVPDLAICRFNVRIAQREQAGMIRQRLQDIVATLRQREGISLELHGGFHAMPKLIDAGMQQLIDHVTACGRELGLDLAWRPTGGVCDGNRLAAAGLPTVDTLGVRGGNIHSDTEFIHLESLVERAKLSALLLMKLGSGEIVIDGIQHGG